MSLSGPAFYDDDAVFRTYNLHRNRPDNPNETLEGPILFELAGNLADRRILDLGCGDAAFGREAFRQGCASYVGVDGSHRMSALARQTLAGTAGQIIEANLEDWEYFRQSVDLVVSRLTLQYLSSLASAIAGAYAALVPGGRFVFSIEHPVITSCSRGWRGQTPRQDWIVDNYFEVGPRETDWLGGRVVKYHRTIEDHYMELQRAGFFVETLREASPRREHFVDESTYLRRLRIPLFLLVAARKT